MRQRIKFTDERVCKSHLLDSCPHDILSGTVSTRVGQTHLPDRYSSHNQIRDKVYPSPAGRGNQAQGKEATSTKLLSCSTLSLQANGTFIQEIF